MDRFAAEKLQSIDQLPELQDQSLELVWGIEDTHGDTYQLIKLGDKEGWPRKLRKQPSRKLQVKGVNLLAADVAQEQRRIIRGQSAPRSYSANPRTGIPSD